MSNDTLHRALKVSDEQVLFLREQLTEAHAAIEREQAERRAERADLLRQCSTLGEEIGHLRQGIAVYHQDYEFWQGEVNGEHVSIAIEEWRERDRNRAEGRQMEIGEVKP